MMASRLFFPFLSFFCSLLCLCASSVFIIYPSRDGPFETIQIHRFVGLGGRDKRNFFFYFFFPFATYILARTLLFISCLFLVGSKDGNNPSGVHMSDRKMRDMGREDDSTNYYLRVLVLHMIGIFAFFTI